MGNSESWIEAINSACSEKDAAESNKQITWIHYRLSEALAAKLGRESGPNFHTWAVWGSRKAGSTIRQEDLDSAISNATRTAGIVGGLVGGLAGMFLGRSLRWRLDAFNIALGIAVGIPIGGWAGRQIAISSRAKAAALILEGNRTVLKDIGQQSARFLELLESGASPEARELFFAGLSSGPTEQMGQDRLRSAFRCYLHAFDAHDLKERQAALIEGNCQIVFHEHIRLEPYIRGAMPFIVRRCVTQRLMTYEVGDKEFKVSESIAGIPAAKNWARIEDRMRYVFALFQQFHLSSDVFLEP